MQSPAQPRTQGPGRPKDMEKRAAILEAAGALFVRNAFAGTSMDAVASEAGVSKLTVYSHFGDKDNLFREVIRAHVQDLLPDATYVYDAELDIRDCLLRIALAHARIECEPGHAGTFRAILSDCRQGNPRYGRLMWEEGPMRTQALMRRLLEDAVADDRLQIEDIARAACQFMALIKGDLMMRRMFGCVECNHAYAAEIEATARAGVDMFLRAYRPR